MKTWVIGDIHGAYKALVQLIDRLDLKSTDSLIFLGDYADGWSETPQVIDLLIEIRAKYNTIMLKGNHDDLCKRYLSGEKMDESWYFHGGTATENAYKNADKFLKYKHLEFLNSLKMYHIDTQNRLFVHGGFTHLRGAQHEYFENMLFQDRTLWELAVAVHHWEGSLVHYPKRLQLYKEIFIGHTPTTRYNSTLPMHCSTVWNVDTGVAFTGCISAVEVSSKEIIQSDSACVLYPNENGRN